MDVQAGRSAGVYTCAVTYGMGDLEDLRSTKPDYLIDDFRALREIIEE